MKKHYRNFLFPIFTSSIIGASILFCSTSCNKQPEWITVKSDKNVVLQNGEIQTHYDFCAINLKDKLGSDKKFRSYKIEKYNESDIDVNLRKVFDLDNDYNFNAEVIFAHLPSTPSATTTFKFIFTYWNVISTKEEFITIDNFSLTYNAPEHSGSIQLDPECVTAQTVKDEGLSIKTATFTFVIKETPHVPQVIHVNFVNGQCGQNLVMYNDEEGKFDRHASAYPDENHIFKIQVGFIDGSGKITEQINKLTVDMKDGRALYDVDLTSTPLSIENV